MFLKQYLFSLHLATSRGLPASDPALEFPARHWLTEQAIPGVEGCGLRWQQPELSPRGRGLKVSAIRNPRGRSGRNNSSSQSNYCASGSYLSNRGLKTLLLLIYFLQKFHGIQFLIPTLQLRKVRFKEAATGLHSTARRDSVSVCVRTQLYVGPPPVLYVLYLDPGRCLVFKLHH